MSAEEWTREQEELRRLIDSAKNDLNKMIGFERDGLREQYISRKRDCRRKLKQVAVAYPRLEQELQNTGGLTDGELRRRAKELKKLGIQHTNNPVVMHHM